MKYLVTGMVVMLTGTLIFVQPAQARRPKQDVQAETAPAVQNPTETSPSTEEAAGSFPSTADSVTAQPTNEESTQTPPEVISGTVSTTSVEKESEIPAAPKAATQVSAPSTYRVKPTVQIATASNGIPKDLDSCLAALEHQLSKQELEEFKKKNPSQLAAETGSLGAWLSDNWIKPSGSPLREFFNQKGIFKPDQISALIIKEFHQHLNKQPINLDADIEKLREIARSNEASRQK